MEWSKEIQEKINTRYDNIIGGEIAFTIDGIDASDYIKLVFYDRVMNFCKEKTGNYDPNRKYSIKTSEENLALLRNGDDAKYIMGESESLSRYISYVTVVMRNYISQLKVRMIKDKEFRCEVLKSWNREMKINKILDEQV